MLPNKILAKVLDKETGVVQSDWKNVEKTDQPKRRGRKRVFTEEFPARRYNLVLPEALYQEVEQLAILYHIPVVEFIRKSIGLGVIAAKVQANENAQLILYKDGKERELEIF